MEQVQKHRIAVLKAQREVVKSIDNTHMRAVLDLKKVYEYIELGGGKKAK